MCRLWPPTWFHSVIPDWLFGWFPLNPCLPALGIAIVVQGVDCQQDLPQTSSTESWTHARRFLRGHHISRPANGPLIIPTPHQRLIWPFNGPTFTRKFGQLTSKLLDYGIEGMDANLTCTLATSVSRVSHELKCNA